MTEATELQKSAIDLSIPSKMRKFIHEMKVFRMTLKNQVNPFSTSVPLTDKPGSWFLLAKCFKKHLWKSDILSRDAGLRFQPAALPKVTPTHGCFLRFLNGANGTKSRRPSHFEPPAVAGSVL